MIDIRKEIKQHYIWIKAKTKDKEKLLYRIYKKQIEIYDTNYKEDYIFLKIKEQDFKTCKKITYYKFIKAQDVGVFAFINQIKKRYLILISMVLLIITIYFLSNVIVSVNVIHSSKEIRELVQSELEENGLHIFSMKKNFEELEAIKKKILDKNKDVLEWLEIESKGMTYTIRIEERIITEKEIEKSQCHIVATKSGIIRGIIHQKGVVLVQKDDYVNIGDILISGQIKVNEEVKNNICAVGEVYAEVWYTTKISIPLEIEEQIKTGKTRNNLKVTSTTSNYKILRSRLETFVDNDKKLFSLFNHDFYFTKEEEIEITYKKLTENEALEKALKLVDEKMKTELGDKGEIIDKKVLKKSLNDSTMDIEIFVSVSELISREQEFVIEDIKEGE